MCAGRCCESRGPCGLWRQQPQSARAGRVGEVRCRTAALETGCSWAMDGDWREPGMNSELLLGCLPFVVLTANRRAGVGTTSNEPGSRADASSQSSTSIFPLPSSIRDSAEVFFVCPACILQTLAPEVSPSPLIHAEKRRGTGVQVLQLASWMRRGGAGS